MDVVPFGPRKIAPKNQVSIPKPLLSKLGLEVGDDVWLMLNPDKPGTLLVLSRDAMAELTKKGWTSL